jgi:hypothetical protein
MGSSPSKSKKMIKEQEPPRQIVDGSPRVLILGISESGKSTIFKQFKILFGQTWNDEARKDLKCVMCANLIWGMRELLEHTENLDEETEKVSYDIRNMYEDSEITQEVAKSMKMLWGTEQVQKVWKERANYQILGAVEHFISRIDALSASDYISTDEDILYARVRTSGIVEEKYDVEQSPLVFFGEFLPANNLIWNNNELTTFIDVGGARNERKKWIHAFDSVSALVYVVGISEYDQVLYEDRQSSRMHESIKLFTELCASSWFTNCPILLLFNKFDLFQQKIKDTPIRIAGVRYEDFEGPYAQDEDSNYEECERAAKDYFTNLFLAQKKDKQVYTYFINGIDGQEVLTSFLDFKHKCLDVKQGM